MKISQLAINSISTNVKGDLPRSLAAYAQAGFRQVEFALPHVKDWMSAGHTLDEVRQVLKSNNLRAIGGFQTHLECFTSPDSKEANLAVHLENAELIHELGGGTLVIGTDGPSSPSLDSLSVIAGRLRDLAEQIDRYDINVALEFNWSPIVKSLDSAVLIVQQVNHPRVGVLFDPAHYYTTFTKFEHLNARTIPWIKHVHLDDMRDKPADFSHCNSDRVLPGQGILNLRAMIAVLEEYGYNGWFSIEMFDEDLWKLPVEDAAQECYQSLLPFCE